MASGNTLITFNAQNGEPPTTTPATWRMRNDHVAWDFLGGSATAIVFSGVMPQGYAAGGVDVILHITVDGTAGDLDFDVEFERVTGQDIDVTSFAAPQSTDGTAVPGVSGVPVEITVSLANGGEMDSVVAGDSFRMRVTRQGGDDTNTDLAQILKAEVREQ